MNPRSFSALKFEERGEWMRKEPLLASFGQLDGEQDPAKSLNMTRCFPIWKDADPSLPEVEDARKRLADFWSFWPRGRFHRNIPGSPKPSLTGLDVLIYAPSRWLKGQTAAKMLTRRARPKTKFLYYTRRSFIVRQIQIMIKSIGEANVLI